MTVYRQVENLHDGKQIERISSEPFPPQDISYEPENVLAHIVVFEDVGHIVFRDENMDDDNASN